MTNEKAFKKDLPDPVILDQPSSSQLLGDSSEKPRRQDSLFSTVAIQTHVDFCHFPNCSGYSAHF